MAAALRYSARRICGHALRQRPHASVAVEDGQRRLLTRLVHSGTPASYPRSSRFSVSGAAQPRDSNTKKLLQGLTSNKEENTVNCLKQIHKKKEELYSLLAECERSRMVGRIGRPNCQLLELLSVQVDPKPSDPRWYSYRGGKLLSDCLRYSGAFFIGQTIARIWFDAFAEADAKEEGNHPEENN